MENYKKGKNIEEALERDKIPISNLPYNFLWMQIRGGSKIRNLLQHAINELPETKSVVWTGFGPSVGKAVTCAEITKRHFGNKLHQITRLCYRQDEEYWDPLIPELDQLVVKRKLPMIHILLSIDPLDDAQLGYQPPGVLIPFEDNNNKKRRFKAGKHNRTPTKEFAALKMSNRKKSRQNDCKEKPNNSSK